MLSNDSHSSRFAGVFAGAVIFSIAACVDLTKPPELREIGRTGGAGGGQGGGTSTSTDPVGTGGVADAAAGGAGGVLADAAPDSPPRGTGGAVGAEPGPDGPRPVDVGAGGGAEGGAGGAGGGRDAAPDLPRAGGAGGHTGGTGGVDAPLGGTDGRVADVPPEALRDLGADRGPDSGPDTRPDLAVDTVDAIPLPPGLVAYYPCESATAGVLPDRSGNGNDATLKIGVPADGGPSPTGAGYRFEPGRIGNALTLLRAGFGYASMPPSIFNGATAITFVAWVKVNTAQNWQRVLDVGINAHADSNSSSGTKYFNLVPQNDSSQLELAITTNGYGNQETLRGSPINVASGWKHLAVSFDGSQGALYVDGQRVAITSNMSLSPADLGVIDYAYLGLSQFAVDPHFDGQLDEVRIYRRILTAAEVQTLAQLTEP